MIFLTRACLFTIDAKSFNSLTAERNPVNPWWEGLTGETGSTRMRDDVPFAGLPPRTCLVLHGRTHVDDDFRVRLDCRCSGAARLVVGVWSRTPACTTHYP